MEEIINPYIAGAPVTEQRLFFGREDIFQWIENSLAGQFADHILVVHGQRRVGKTSVLKQLGNRLPKKYIPVFFDLQGRTHTTLDRFLWWLAREIVRVLKQERDIEVPIPEKESFTSDPEYFENKFLAGLRPILGENSLLLTFDEFDNLEESEVKEELARPLVDYLRRMMGEAGLNFIFSIGSSGRKLENMQASYTEFFKTALYKKISFLAREQTQGLITRPVEGVLEYDRAAVDMIFETTFGHPYFTQLMCHELFARCQRTEQRRVAKSDVEAIFDDVVERGTVNLKFVWDEASDIEKWILSALANMEGKTDNHALADFLRKNRVRFSETDLTSGLLHLREKDVLTPENRFVIQLLKIWLQKNRPIEQAREELTEVNPIANRYIEIGLEFKDSRLFDKAIESFQEALAIAKDNVQAQVNIALTYVDMKLPDKAVVEFEKALAMDDEDVSARAGLCEAHLALGDSALTRGRAKEATLSYQRVLGINAEHLEARGRMAEISRQRAEKALTDGRDEEALSAFSDALKHTPEDPDLIARVEKIRAEKKAKLLAAFLARSEKEAGAKNWDGAIKALEEASALAPEDVSIQKRIREVKAAQEKARLDALLVKADAAAKSARWDEAVQALSAVLATQPDEMVEAKLADVRAKQRAVKMIELKIQARGHARGERFDESLSAWEAYLGLNPSDRNDAQAEVEEVKKAQGLAVSYAEAQKAYARKNYDQAVSLLKGVINQNENYKDASHLLAESIELRRTARKWWNSRWLRGGIAGFAFLLISWLAFRYGAPLLTTLQVTPTVPFSLTNAPANATKQPTQIAATASLTATATPLPYTWARLNSGQFLPRDQINAIVFDSNDPGVIYVGTQSAGIYKSIDGGISWQPIHTGLERASIDTLVIDPDDPQILYAGALQGGVFKTNDGGQKWEYVYPTPGMGYPDTSVIAIDPQNSQHLAYTRGSGNIRISNDGGMTWEPIAKADCPSGGVRGLAFHPADGTLFASEENVADCSHGIYRYNLEINDFEMLHESDIFVARGLLMDIDLGGNLYLFVDEANLSFVLSEDGSKRTDLPGCHLFTADPSGGVIAVCNSLLSRTVDGGQSWETLGNLNSAAIDNIGVDEIAVSPHDPNLILLGGRGLLISTDRGATWKESSNGLPAVRLDLHPIYPAMAGIFMETIDRNTWDSKIFFSSDSGFNWELIAENGIGLSVTADGTRLYRYRSNNGNIMLSFTPSQSGLWDQNILSITQEVRQLKINPFNSDQLLISNYAERPPYIYFSTDAGGSWDPATGIPSSESDFHEMGLFFLPSPSLTVYAMGIWNAEARSEDGGKTWTTCGEPNNLWLGASEQSRIAVSTDGNERVYLATRGDGVYISNDKCQTWSPNNIGLGSLFVNSIVIDPNNPETIYAGTDGGAYISFDSGQTWNQINDGLLGATVVYSIVVDKDSNVYAATPYGIFKLEGK